MDMANRLDVRRAVTAMIATTLVVSAAPSAARTADVVRVETKEYQSPAVALMPIHPAGAAVCNQGGALPGERGCVDFPLLSARERFLKVEVQDASGLPVPAFLAWGEDPSEWIAFCGSTERPLRARAATATVWLYPYRSPNLPICPGTATTGSVTVTFLARR